MGGSSASEPWWSVKDSDFTINNSEKLRFNREKLWSGHWNNEEWICVCVHEYAYSKYYKFNREF